VSKRHFIVIGRGKRVETRLTIKNFGWWQAMALVMRRRRHRLPSRPRDIVAAVNSGNPVEACFYCVVRIPKHQRNTRIGLDFRYLARPCVCVKHQSLLGWLHAA